MLSNFNTTTVDLINNNPAYKQYSLPIIKAQEAWALTTGRAHIASMDGGVIRRTQICR
jgi:hypothetical protein